MAGSRVVLVYPKQGFSGTYVRHAPLSLLYAAAEVVKNGYDVKILDSRLCPNDWREKLEALITPDTRIVGVSVMSGQPINNAISIGRYVKKHWPHIKVVWGGPHATFYPDTIIEQEWSCDYVISGYGSKPFADLVDCIVEGRKPEHVTGVSWRDGETVFLNPSPDQTFENIDWRDIPYHLVDDYSPYGQVDQDRKIFSMYSALGCPYQCSFCSSPAQYRPIKGKKWVRLPAEDIVDHIEFLVDTYGANYIYFIDDDSFPSLKHVSDIIDGIAARGLNVKLGFRGARINEIKRMDDAFLSKLAAAGTDIMHIGAESGSDRILQLLRKDATAEDILECNRKLARHPEIKAAYNIMMGIPTETLDDLKKTRDLILQLIKDHPNCIVFPPNKFRPLPGTELYDLASQEWGYEMPSSLEAWANIEVEGEVNPDWYEPGMRRFCDLMLVCSYFIDNKVVKVSEGRTAFTRAMRVLNYLYRPIAKFRLRHGFSAMLLEYTVYRWLTRRLSGAEAAR